MKILLAGFMVLAVSAAASAVELPDTMLGDWCGWERKFKRSDFCPDPLDRLTIKRDEYIWNNAKEGCKFDKLTLVDMMLL
jgi:hypothetical protein